MSDHLIAGDCVLVLDGREYVRHETTWYDAKTHIRVTDVDARRLDSLLRQSPDLLESLAIKARGQLEERHAGHLQRHGIADHGRGPSTRSVQRAAHCWECRQSLDSRVDLECYGCHWILCQCGACGCGYHGWNAI